MLILFFSVNFGVDPLVLAFASLWMTLQRWKWKTFPDVLSTCSYCGNVQKKNFKFFSLMQEDSMDLKPSLVQSTLICMIDQMSEVNHIHFYSSLVRACSQCMDPMLWKGSCNEASIVRARYIIHLHL